MALQLNPPHTRIHHLFDERAAQAPAHPFLYLKQGVMTLGELAQQVDLLEAELGVQAIRDVQPLQPGDVVATAADTSRLAAWVGFSPSTPIATGVARFAAWYKAWAAA